MPWPVSETSSKTLSWPSPSACARTSTDPCGRLYLMALDTRFSSTWRKRVASACTPRASATSTCTATPRVSASPSVNTRTCSATSATGTGERFSKNSPPSSRERSITSSIKAWRWRPAAVMCRSRASTRAASALPSSSIINCVNPSIAFRGVRSSWPTRVRNRERARISRSRDAASRRCVTACRVARASTRRPTNKRINSGTSASSSRLEAAGSPGASSQPSSLCEAAFCKHRPRPCGHARTSPWPRASSSWAARWARSACVRPGTAGWPSAAGAWAAKEQAWPCSAAQAGPAAASTSRRSAEPSWPACTATKNPLDVANGAAAPTVVSACRAACANAVKSAASKSLGPTSEIWVSARTFWSRACRVLKERSAVTTAVCSRSALSSDLSR